MSLTEWSRHLAPGTVVKDYRTIGRYDGNGREITLLRRKPNGGGWWATSPHRGRYGFSDTVLDRHLRDGSIIIVDAPEAPDNWNTF